MKETNKDNPKPKYMTQKENDRAWSFKAPQYDERSSCYINAGDKHGVGHRQPVGHTDGVKVRVDTMPFGRPKTLKVDEKD
jgi:hypothetical protein